MYILQVTAGSSDLELKRQINSPGVNYCSKT